MKFSRLLPLRLNGRVPPGRVEAVFLHCGFSAWMGKVQDDLDPVVRKSVQDRGNTLHVFTEAEAAEFRRLTAPVESEWIEEVTKRGFDGKRLLDNAKALIAKHNRRT